MNREPLHAHSVCELQLFLMATCCENCGRGPLVGRALPAALQDKGGQGPPHGPFSMTAHCDACRHEHRFTFTLPDDAPADDRNNLYPVINPTSNPSRILDVGQWIVLFRVILEAASKEKAKIEARRLGYEAAQCLEEAIKFYEDNDLPPESAIFCESTRRRLRERPDLFSRQNLIEMRAKLPKLATMQTQISGAVRQERARKRPWWRFWQY